MTQRLIETLGSAANSASLPPTTGVTLGMSNWSEQGASLYVHTADGAPADSVFVVRQVTLAPSTRITLDGEDLTLSDLGPDDLAYMRADLSVAEQQGQWVASGATLVSGEQMLDGAGEVSGFAPTEPGTDPSPKVSSSGDAELVATLGGTISQGAGADTGGGASLGWTRTVDLWLGSGGTNGWVLLQAAVSDDVSQKVEGNAGIPVRARLRVTDSGIELVALERL